MPLPKRPFQKVNEPVPYPVHLMNHRTSSTISHKRQKQSNDSTNEIPDNEDNDNDNEEEDGEQEMEEVNFETSIDQGINKIVTDSSNISSSGHNHGPLDPIFGQRRVFPVAIDMTQVELGKEPKDVGEYLAMVRLEAQKFDRSTLAKHRDDNEPEYDEEEYKEDKEHDDHDAGPRSNKLKIDTEFMVDYNSKRSQYAEYRSTLTEVDAIDLPASQKAWKFFIFNNEPTAELITQVIEENEHMKLIVYFTKWLNMNLNENFELWIFELLNSIDDLLDGKDMSVIRGLGKKARKQMENGEKGDGNGLDSRNKVLMMRILSVVAGFYGQRDLLL